MDEIKDVLLRFLGEGSAWLIVGYFAKGWFESKILEPLNDLKKEIKEAKEDAVKAGDKASTASFQVFAQSAELRQQVTAENQKMVNYFSEAARSAAKAEVEAQVASGRVKILEQLTEKTDVKFMSVGARIFGMVKKVEGVQEKVKTDIEEIRKDVFLIKGKNKNEPSQD